MRLYQNVIMSSEDSSAVNDAGRPVGLRDV